jgi:subtilisin-like proprotein convertase family protein
MRRFGLLGAACVAAALILPAPTATAIYSSSDVPKTIPTAQLYPGYATTTSTLTVPPGRPPIGVVRVRTIGIDTNAMWDLDGALKSPSGKEVRLFSRLCSGSAPGPTPPPLSSSTLFGFSDEATGRLGGSGCPGSAIWQPDYGPSGSEWGDGWGGCPMTLPDFCPLRLSDMAGDPSSGTWTLGLRDNVVDATESGTLASWSIEILRPPIVFPASGMPLQVPDNGTASSSINVPSDGPSIAMLNIGRLRFAHNQPDGVSLTLVAPDGRVVPLTSCGNASSAWTDPGPKGTTLSDESLWPAFSCGWNGPTAHTPGFGLTQFQNRSAAGTWTLRVQDTVADGRAAARLVDRRLPAPRDHH